MKKTWYYLDPDNNKKDPTSPHCARCKRKLHDAAGEGSFKIIIFHPSNPWYRIAGAFERSEGLIGESCHQQMIKEYGEQTDE